MDRSDDREPFFHLSSSSSSPALVYLSTNPDHTPTTTKQQSQGFDFSARDVLSGYEFHTSMQPRRRTFSVEHVSSRRHRSSGSPMYLTGELFSATRKDTEMDSHSSKVVTAVDRTIKKYADNILRVLEGMNGRLAQVESVTQVLEHSVASLKVSVDDYHNEADARSKALNNHVMEMHQAVQILRDKQDIVETNAELAKLQASKAEVVCEKVINQPVVSSLMVTQEQLTVVVPEKTSTELQVSSQQSNEISGQLQQLSVSADVNTLPQQLAPTQARTLQPIQQSHVWSQSESHPTLQPQEMIQSMPGVFQPHSQHVQTQQIVQPQQRVFQAQPQQVQTQQSLQSQNAVFHAQQQHVQTQQNLQSQQGTFQAQPQHVQTQQSVQLQGGLMQAQQQQLHIQQSAQSQEGALQATQQTLPFQQGAFQTQAHHLQPQQGILAPQGVFQAQPQHVQPQQGIQAPQGVFQAQPQHVQIQQIAQSQGGAFQSQQQYSQTQQIVRSQPGVIQAQPQQVQTQQSIQPHRGPQVQPFQGPVRQLPQPPSQTAKQTTIITPHSEQARFQVVPQQMNIQQPPSVGQPSVHVPSTQFGSTMQILPAQQLSQVQPASNFQMRNPQNNLSSQSMVGQQPPHMQQTSNAHSLLQGVPAGQGSFQFTQQNESFSHVPLSQVTFKQAPSQSEYSADNFSSTGSSPQPLSSHPMLPAQHSNTYDRIPSPLQGPQPVYQTARPVITGASALPVAQNVYNQSLSRGLPNHLSRDDGIVEKVAEIGFSKDEARSAIKRLTDQGQIVDMNVVLDLLINGRNQSQRGWQAR